MKPGDSLAIEGMFDSISSKYDLLNDIFSFGLHRAWKSTSLAGARCWAHSLLPMLMLVFWAPLLTEGHVSGLVGAAVHHCRKSRICQQKQARTNKQCFHFVLLD